MISYNYNGKQVILRKATYSDGHLCILVDDNERLSTNFDKANCKRGLGKDLSENEILICMTPSMEHPMIRGLALSLEEDGLIMCMYDFIRTYNEYYRYKVFEKTLNALASDEIIAAETLF